jgi:hypothetical protein
MNKTDNSLSNWAWKTTMVGSSARQLVTLKGYRRIRDGDNRELIIRGSN